jgi:hypothetical protein
MSRARDTSLTQVNSGGAVAPFNSGKNFIINGGFDIWQRGASSSSDGYRTADRFYSTVQAGTGTWSQGTTTPPVGAQYYYRFTSGTSNSTINNWTALERNIIIPLRGQVVTLSGYIRGSYTGGFNLLAGYSNSTDLLSTIISSGTIPSGAAIINNPVTSSWVRYQTTFTMPSDAVGLAILTSSYSVPMASGQTLDVWGLQLEIGSTATPFSRSGVSIQGELAACQRYYQTSFDLGQTPAHNSSNIGETTLSCFNGGFSTNCYGAILFPVKMRTAPIINIWNTRNSSATGNSAKFYSAGVAYDTTTIDMGVTTSSSHGLTFKSNNMGASAIVFFGYSASAEL